ncbi:MFS transporter [Curtobacterium sp. MCBD17_035]|uniref:MFS transporter n=1 Tax=Curtobacterium sp. MCBD17_035 TaxID=2175673 RepID=UPI000DA8F2A0|nr:MFS transporter [Curtobacterium sp. MCBD17_035]WIB68914.1 MFS transporter [Curtobacterium sp. MCBD17_035]
MLTVLRIPDALRAFIPALVGRSALAMASLGIVLAVQESTSSFAAAGVAAAVFGVANVVAAPSRARAVDRWGQRRALTTLGASQAAGLAVLAASVAAHAPLLIILAESAVIGVTAPPLGAAMRVIWAALTQPGEQRKQAFSVDAVAEELLFVIGPVLIASVITATTAAIGLLLTAVVVLVGTLGLTTSTASRAQSSNSSDTYRAQRPLRQPGFPRVLVVLVGVGCVLGVAEIVAPAVAEEHGSVASSGWLLAAFAAGSAIGGVLYGHIRWRATLGTKLLLLAVGMGIVAVGVSQVGGLIWFAGGLVLLGLFLAPSLITGYLVAEAVVPEAARTEASTWVNTAVNLGAALASAATGALIDHADVAVPLALVGLLTVLAASIAPRKQLLGASE